MNKERFNQLLANLNEVTNEDIKSLNELRKKYPFFQTPYVIVAKALKERNHAKTDAFIKKAAIYSPDRSYLKKIIMGEVVFDKEEAQAKPETIVSEPPKPTTSTTVKSKTEDEEVKSKKDEVRLDKPEPQTIAVQEVEDKKTKIEQSPKIAETPYVAPESVRTKAQNHKPAELSELEKDLIEIREKKKRLAALLSKQEELATEKNSKGSKKRGKAQVELIEKFIQNEPQFDKRKNMVVEDDSHQEDLSIKHLKPKDEFATETLAQLMLKQKKYGRALDIYEKLSLKFPEKSSYFATQIQKVKEAHNV